MSVRKGDRTSGKLEVLNCISVLSSHTIRTCRSEKVFPKSSRWIMAKPIVDECISAFTCVRRANSVLVKTQQDYEYRRSQQVEAHSHLEALLSLIDLAYNAFDIEARRVEYWTGLVLQADELLKSWMRSDKKRYE